MLLSLYLKKAKGVIIICYNCGCGMPNDDMGKGKISRGGGSLTEDDLKHLAEKWGVGINDVKKNILSELKKQFKE